VAEATDAPGAAPKLHGTFTLTRLGGAGVALEDLGSDDEPDHVVLGIGDSATNLTLDGTLDEVRWLIAEAGAQLANLREAQAPGSYGPRTEELHEHYQRIVAAAAIRPAIDLTGGGQVVLSWLARGDDTVCEGVVELINAARATVEASTDSGDGDAGAGEAREAGSSTDGRRARGDEVARDRL
jgi:hypothetical protein